MSGGMTSANGDLIYALARGDEVLRMIERWLIRVCPPLSLHCLVVVNARKSFQSPRGHVIQTPNLFSLISLTCLRMR